jgi:hypothetical protein
VKQDQRGGEGSTNIQAAVVHVHHGGLSRDEVREIALEVWQGNMTALAQVARDTADTRASLVREDILRGLEAGQGDADGFEQPEKQLALLQAQKGYAISGDDELRKTLVNAVLSISKEPERSMKAIVLQEAIEVLPSLTRRQVAGITAAFVVRFVTFGSASSFAQLLGLWERFIDANAGVPTDGDLRHLEYCGCGKASVLQLPLPNLIRQVYPGLVSGGITPEVFKDAFRDEGIPLGSQMPCLNDPTLVQLAALNEDVLKQKAQTWSEGQRTAASQLLTQNLLVDDKIIEMAKASPFGETLFTAWTNWLQRIELTSVGLAVGHSHANAIEPNFAPLEIWL